MGHHPGAALGVKGLVIGEGMEVMRGVLRDEFGDIQVLLGCDGHRVISRWLRKRREGRGQCAEMTGAYGL